MVDLTEAKSKASKILVLISELYHQGIIINEERRLMKGKCFSNQN
jgi:hypothetical protein